MNRKIFIIALLVLTLFTLNFSVAQDIDNSTNALSVQTDSVNQSVLKIPSQIDVACNTTMDVIGDEFKIRLSDENDTAIANAKVTFTLNGINYTRNTDDDGFAFLKLWLDDGSYDITANFLGNDIYQSSSLTTAVTMNNTITVDDSLSNSEIQNIIDNSKQGNVILFNGASYSDVNLVITKSLTLISNSNTVLTSSSASPVITIKGRNASSTTLNGFVIKGKGNGIAVDNADFVIIKNNEVTTGGNGIVATGTKYLNITNNSIVKNSKEGIIVLNDEFTYIVGNAITDNGDGVMVSKSNNTYIFENEINGNINNGIITAKTVNGVNYGEGPLNLNIANNNINENGDSGINLVNARENLKITGNAIYSNKIDGISVSDVRSNLIQSNVLFRNHDTGIRFAYDYVKPEGQEISYNVMYFNSKELEARDTFYEDFGEQLEVEDNWYTDWGFVCPKIKTNNIKLIVSQLGGDYFQATFLDSKGKIASLLPERTLSYETSDGNTVSLTISGGTAVFKVSGISGDSFKAVVDKSERNADYDKNLPDADLSNYQNGKSPSYSYPSIPYEIGGEMGDGDGNGNGAGGNSNNGNGNSPAESSRSTGNATSSQRTDPSSNANNPVNDVSQSLDVQSTTSPASSSTNGGATSVGGEKQSVVKQIIIDEEDIYKVTGISFIILLILLTIGFYYRDDIKEMKSEL